MKCTLKLVQSFI